MSERNLSIDLIKIIAMILVVLFHLANYLWTPDHAFLNFIGKTCGVAVPLFFMVSGYLMAGKEVSWSYCFHKILNILKVTFLVCILYDIYTYLRYHEFVLSFPICFLQKSEWWHLWYFGTMIIIYLLLPFLEKAINSNRFKTVIIQQVLNFRVIDIKDSPIFIP